MSAVSRRSVVKFCAALPFVGPMLASATVEAHPVILTEREKRRLVGVSIARMLNTAQMRYRHIEKQFGTLTALASSSAVAKFLDSEKASQKGIGRQLFATLDLPLQQSAGGWRFRLTLNGDATRYVFVLTDLASDQLPTIVTDDQGMIYEGKLKSSMSGGDWRPAAAVIEGSPIGTKPRPTGIRRFLQSVTAAIVVPLHADHCSGGTDCCCNGWCCHSTPCACIDSCHSSHPDPGGELEIECTNCGCPCCRWCCG